MSTFKSTPDRDGDFIDFTSNLMQPAPHIAIIGAGDNEDSYYAACLTRDDAAALATHLTAAVEAADAREAAEARKLKRGDRVRLGASSRDTLYTIVSDETEGGFVDVVRVRPGYPDRMVSGLLLEGQAAHQFVRVAE